MIQNTQASTIANLVEQMWLCIDPRPAIIMHDCGNEFLGNTFKVTSLKMNTG